MTVISAILAGLATYFLLYEILFEDREEFVKKLKDLVVWSPVWGVPGLQFRKRKSKNLAMGTKRSFGRNPCLCLSPIVDLVSKVALTELMPT